MASTRNRIALARAKGYELQVLKRKKAGINFVIGYRAVHRVSKEVTNKTTLDLVLTELGV